MKKLFFLVFLSVLFNAQTNPYWGTSGSSVASGGWLGTKNSRDLIFKANNVEVARFGVGGVFSFSNGKNLSEEDFTTALKNKLNGLPSSAEPLITTGTISQYWRGDKSWQTLNKSAVGLNNVDNTSDSNKPISTATQTVLDTKQTVLVSGTNIKTFNGNSLLGSGNITYKNEAGQVKINFSGLSITGFTSGIANAKQFNIGGGTPTVVSSPTTKYPNSTPNNYSGVFDSSRNGGTTTFSGRFIENPIPGQSHRWRITGNYSGRTTLLAETQTLYIRLRNPVSGFIALLGVITLAPQQATGDFSGTVETIADTASIPSPNGYILEAYTTYTDGNLVVNINSITRFSDAYEP